MKAPQNCPKQSHWKVFLNNLIEKLKIKRENILKIQKLFLTLHFTY